LAVGGCEIAVRQTTKYPWDGTVKIELEAPAPRTVALHLRLPGWCTNATLLVNGSPWTAADHPTAGYLTVEREWTAGDTLEFRMDMPVQILWANPAIRYLQGRMALQRGPLVYCLEGVDHGGIALDRIALDPASAGPDSFGVEYRDRLLGGVAVLRGNGSAVGDEGWEGVLYRRERPACRPFAITAVPYYAWDNRAPGEMRVWIRAFSG
jgi:DUF1680 family protein